MWPTRCVHVLIRRRGNGLLLSVLCEGINNLALNVGLWKVRVYSNVCAHLQKTLKVSKCFSFIYHFIHLHSSKPFNIMFLLFQYCVFSCVLNRGLVVHLDRFVCFMCFNTADVAFAWSWGRHCWFLTTDWHKRCSNIKSNETSWTKKKDPFLKPDGFKKIMWTWVVWLYFYFFHWVKNQLKGTITVAFVWFLLYQSNSIHVSFDSHYYD